MFDSEAQVSKIVALTQVAVEHNILYTTDIEVQGMFIFENEYLSPAAMIAYTEQSTKAVLQAFQLLHST